MVFQIQRPKSRIAISLAILVLVAVMPVSADLLNGYYRVAPNIQQGATLFIGEQGLNVTDALATANAAGVPGNTAYTTVGWWESAATITNQPPDVSINLGGRATYFTVTQFEFDGYEGQWYLVASDLNQRAKPGVGAVFNVKAPKLDISIRNPDQFDGADVSGTSVPIGTRLQFQIGTNMYTVQDPLLRNPVYGAGSGVNTSGYLDIKVKCDNGTTLTRLYDNQLSYTLIALNVTTQPYTWGRANLGLGPGILYVWNTSTYPPGTYTVNVVSKLNNMQTNYLSGGAPYPGRTVSETKTITLVGDIPVTSANTKIGIYKDGAWYLDMNGNGVWDGPQTDKLVPSFGLPGWTQVTGDWNGDGRTKIGIYKDGTWYLDTNGNGAWDGAPSDTLVTAFGMPTWTPIVGDWNGDTKTDIGIYKDGTWYLDMNGNGAWDGSTTDRLVTSFGMPGWTPVIGKWS